MSIDSSQRRDVNDVAAAALLHLRDRFVATIENAADIRFQHGAKIFRRSFLDGFEDANARVVDENIEALEFLDRMVDERFDLMVIAHVASKTDRATVAQSIQLIDSLIDLVLVARADAHRNAFAK